METRSNRMDAWRRRRLVALVVAAATVAAATVAVAAPLSGPSQVVVGERGRYRAELVVDDADACDLGIHLVAPPGFGVHSLTTDTDASETSLARVDAGERVFVDFDLVAPTTPARGALCMLARHRLCGTDIELVEAPVCIDVEAIRNPLRTVASLIATPSQICIDPAVPSNVSLDASASVACPGGTIPNPGGYAWMSNPGGPGPGNSDMEVFVMPAGQWGQVDVTVTVTDDLACVDADTVSLYFDPPPDPILTVTPSSLCRSMTQNQTVVLDATLSGFPSNATPATYGWMVPVGHSTNGSGPVVDWIVPAGAVGPFNGSVLITDVAMCTAMGIAPLTVLDIPTAVISPLAAPVCVDSMAIGNVPLSGVLSTPASGSSIPPGGYSWSASRGNPISGNSSTEPLTLPPGDWGPTTVWLTVNDLNTCSDLDSVSFDIWPEPVVQLLASPTPTCVTAAGGVILLDATGTVFPSGATGMTWTYTVPVGHFVTQGAPTAVWTVPPGATGPFAASVLIDDSNGCSQSGMVVVNVGAAPTASMMLTPLTCVAPTADAIVTLDGSTTTAGTNPIADPGGYSWMPSLGNPVPGLGSVEMLTVPAGVWGVSDVDLTVTDQVGCSDTARGSAAIWPEPQVIVTANPLSASCLSASAPINVALDAGTSVFPSGATGVSWNWMPPAGHPFTPSGSTASWTIPAGLPGTFMVSVEVTDSNGCTNIGDVSVTVQRPPVAGMDLQPPTQCVDPGVDASITLDGSSTTVGDAPIADPGGYAWSPTLGNPVPGLGSVETLTLPAGVWGTTTVSLTVTDGNFCPDSAMADASVWPEPQVVVIANPTSACVTATTGTMIALDATTTTFPSGAVGVSWQWTPPLGHPLTPTGSTATWTIPPGAFGTHVTLVEVTDSNGCTKVGMVSATINEEPTAVLTLLPPTQCVDVAAPAQVVVDASASSPGLGATVADPGGYAWSSSQGDPIVGLGATEILTLPAGTWGQTDVTVVVTNSNLCQDTVIEQAFVWPEPVVSVQATPASMCSSPTDSVVLLDAGATVFPSGATGTNWQWMAPPGHPFLAAGASATWTIPAGEAGTFVVDATVNDSNGCSQSGGTSVVVMGSPAARIVATPPGCVPATEPLVVALDGTSSTSQAPSTIASYSWSVSGPGTLSSTITALTSASYPPGTVGVFTATLTIVDSNGCSASDTVSLVLDGGVRPTAVATVTPPLACEGTTSTSFDLDGSGSSSSDPNDPSLLYAWTASEGDVLSPTDVAPTLSVPVTGSARDALATLVVSTPSGCASEPATVAMRIEVAPVASITPQPAVVGVPTSFGPQVVGGSPPFQVSWDFGDSTIVSGVDDPTHVYQAPGVYIVVMTVLDGNACATSASGEVIVASAEVGLVTLAKIARPTRVSVGGVVEYTLLIESGSGSLHSVLLEDELPVGFVLLPGSVVRDGVSQPDPTDPQLLRFAPFDLAPAVTSSITYRTRVVPGTAPGTYENRASLHALDAADAVVFLGPRRALVDVVATADLSVTKRALADPEPAIPGGLVHYTLDYRNIGEQPATGVELVDTWPSSQATVEDTSGVVSGDRMTWSIGTVAPGAGGSVAYTLRLGRDLSAGTAVRNVVVVSSAEEDATPGNNTAEQTVDIAALPDLVLTKSVAPADPAPGDTVRYTLSYSNRGAGTALQAVIVDDYDEASLELTELPSGASDAGGVLRIELGDLPSGASGSVTYGATVKSGVVGTVVNTARLESTVPDGKPGDETAQASIEVVAAIAELRVTGELVAGRRCHQPQVEVALRSDTYDAAQAMFAATSFFDAAAALAVEDTDSMTRMTLLPLVRGRLLAFARMNTEQLFLRSGMGIPLPDGTPDADGRSGHIGLPFASAHPWVRDDAASAWCDHAEHEVVTSAAVGHSLSAIAAYMGDAHLRDDSETTAHAIELAQVGREIIARLSDWRAMVIDGSPAAHLPRAMRLVATPAAGVAVTDADTASGDSGRAAAAESTQDASVGAAADAAAGEAAGVAAEPHALQPDTGAIDIDAEIAVVTGLGRWLRLSRMEGIQLDATTTSQARRLLEQIIADLARREDLATAAPATIARCAAALRIVREHSDVTVPASLESATTAALQRVAAGEWSSVDDQLAQLRAALWRSDTAATQVIFSSLEQDWRVPGMAIYRSSGPDQAVDYTPVRIATVATTLSELVAGGDAALRALAIERLHGHLQTVLIDAGLQTTVIDRERTPARGRLVIGADGELEVSTVDPGPGRSLSPVMVDRVGFLGARVRSAESRIEDESRTVGPSGLGVAQLYGDPSYCEAARVTLTDPRFATETGLFTAAAMRASGRQLRQHAVGPAHAVISQIGNELESLARSEVTTIQGYARLGIDIEHAVGFERGTLERYAAAAGLSAVPSGHRPSWIELGGGVPHLPRLDDGRYGVGWDAPRLDRRLSPAALGRALATDVDVVVDGLDRVDVDRVDAVARYDALVRLHAASRKLRQLSVGRDEDDLEAVLDSSGRTVSLDYVRRRATLRGTASLLEAVTRYRSVVDDPRLPKLVGALNIPLERDKADQVQARLKATVERRLAKDEVDTLGHWYAAQALVAVARADATATESARSKALDAALRLIDGPGSDDVSSLVSRALALSLAAEVLRDPARVGAIFDELSRSFFDDSYGLFRPDRRTEGERFTDDDFTLTDLDFGAVLRGLGGALPLLEGEQRKVAIAQLTRTVRTMLDRTGMARWRPVELEFAGERTRSRAFYLAHEVQFALTSAVDHSARVFPGDLVRARFEIENTTEKSTADAARVVVQLPSELRFVAGSGGAGSSVSQSASGLVLELGRLAARRPATVEVVLQVSGGARPGTVSWSAVAEGTSLHTADGAPTRSAQATGQVVVESLGGIEGRLWLDLDRDGRSGSREPGVGELTVLLDDGTARVADGGGNFRFDRLLPSSYRVSPQSDDASMAPISGEPVKVPVLSGKIAKAAIAMRVATVLTGLVYRDLDGDFRRGRDEPTVAGAVVAAEGGQTSITDSRGVYVIRGIASEEVGFHIAGRQPWLSDDQALRLLPRSLDEVEP